MSDNKKYYYLKLKENYFDSDEMIVLETMQDGYKYSNILFKLYLRSLKNDGRLMFNEKIPYNPTILSQITRHSVGDIQRAINIFEELGLIEILDNGAIYMLDIQNFIGESSTEADRQRAYRQRISSEKAKLINGVTNDVTNVTTNDETNVRQIYTRDRDRDKDRDKDKDRDRDKDESQPLIPYQEIIEYLNEKTGKNFNYKSTGNRKLIKARWNEGYKLEDFKQVIDNMASNWKDKTFSDGSPAENYLRPQTLFNPSKFDDYLNASPSHAHEVKIHEHQIGQEDIEAYNHLKSQGIFKVKGDEELESP